MHISLKLHETHHGLVDVVCARIETVIPFHIVICLPKELVPGSMETICVFVFLVVMLSDLMPH